MGLAQSDEFMDIYEKFMNEYDNGRKVHEISSELLDGYRKEFDDDDGVLHDVYFALAKAEWMCCEQSEEILKKVREIIESGANIDFYRELEATERDLKVRRKNLEKFLKMLLVPREKPRKRKRNSPEVEKTFPDFEMGDCFAYKYEDGYRVMIVLDRFKLQDQKEMVMVAIFNSTYSAEELKTTAFEKEEFGKLFTVIASDFLGKSSIKKTAHIDVPKKRKSRLLGSCGRMYGDKKTFRSEITDPLSLNAEEFLSYCVENSDDDISSLEVGGCYSYKYKNEFRYAVVLDKSETEGVDYWLVSIHSEVGEGTGADFLNSEPLSVSMYDMASLPNLSGWNKMAVIDVPKNLLKSIFGDAIYITNGILDFARPYCEESRRHLPFDNLEVFLEACVGNSKSVVGSLGIGGYISYKYADGREHVEIFGRYEI